MLDRTTGTRTPEAVEAAVALLEAAISREAVAELSMVLPAELVVVMATTVGAIELAAELWEDAAAELSAEEAAAELAEEAEDESSVEDAITDELRPDEVAPEEGDEDGETEEASEVWEVSRVEDGTEDCAAEEDAAAEEPELCWEEAELWATEEVSEVEAWEEETTDEPEERATTVSELDVGEAELNAEEEADDKSALLSPPVVLEGATDDPVVDAGALVVDGAEVSVLRETDVVLESVTRMASVLVEDASVEEVEGTAMAVALSAELSCLLRSSALTATSCFAISIRR